METGINPRYFVGLFAVAYVYNVINFSKRTWSYKTHKKYTGNLRTF